MSADLLATAAAWLDDDDDPVTRAELEALIARARGVGSDSDDARRDLAERFSGPLEFGTAGMRGILGAGQSRMNRTAVRRVSAGLADYLLAHAPDAKARGVVIGHDARRYSRAFAEDTARILAGRGLRVRLAHRPWPTPTTAWAVTRFGAAGGVMVTASHNPPAYNGYKVYWGDGAQIIPPHDAGIASAVARIERARGLTMPTLDEARAAGMVIDLTEQDHAEYLAAVTAQRAAMIPDLPAPSTVPTPAGMAAATAAAVDARRLLRVAYTPLHGVGAASVEPLFHSLWVAAIHTVPSQREPDGEFPTVAFPNPEEKGAMDAVLALAREVGAELVLANDPDADRLCAAVPSPDRDYRVLTGDQIGVLIADYLLAVTARDVPRLVATTIVSSQLLRALAAHHGADFRETLTGFKSIASAAMAWERATPGGRFIMGYEEALGYTVGDLVRDKDGVSAAAALVDLARWNRDQGRSVLDHLDDLYRRVGLFVTEQVSWTLPGADGVARIRATMERTRSAPPTAIGGTAVTECLDFAVGSSDLPPSDLLMFRLDGGHRVLMRPSGTEPKLKCYYEVRVTLGAGESVETARGRGLATLARLRDAHQATVRGR